ncbi:MAG: hypothetical protein ACRDFT_08695, partial [bacterium]
MNLLAKFLFAAGQDLSSWPPANFTASLEAIPRPILTPPEVKVKSEDVADVPLGLRVRRNTAISLDATLAGVIG